MKKVNTFQINTSNTFLTVLLRFQFIRLSISAWRLKVLLFKKACNLKILYPKEFVFRKDHPFVYALLQLVEQIYHFF